MPSHISSPSVRIARCEVAGQTFGLDMAAIVGVQSRDVVQFGGSPTDEVLGTIASQGRKFPVYSLARCLALPHTESRAGHCIVVTDGVDVWGLLADRVSHSESRTARDVIPLPSLITGSSHSMIRGVVCETDEQVLPLIILNPENIRPAAQRAMEVKSGPALHLPKLQEVATPPHPTQRRLMTFATASAGANSSIRYAFSVTQVEVVTRIPESISLPGSPPLVVGIAAWKGRPLPLIHLDMSPRRAEHPGQATDRMAIVRVPECELPLGLLVSPECEILTCPIPGTPVSAAQIGVPESRVRAAFQRERGALVFPKFTI